MTAKMLIRKKNVLLISVFYTSVLLSQNVEFTKDNFKGNKDGLKEAQRNIEAGDEYYNQAKELLVKALREDYDYHQNAMGMFRFCIDPYLKANEFNTNNALLNYKIGVCYIHSNFKMKALPYLEKAYSLNANVDPQVNYYLGRAHHLGMEWDKAIRAYRQYLASLNPKDKAPEIADVNKKIQECQNGKELVKNPVRVWIDNIGGAVNTSYPEYGPTITTDESVLIFTSRRDNTTGGTKDEFINQYMEDIYISVKKDGKWSPAVNMGPPINTPGHDATVSLSPDGQNLFIYIDEKGNGQLYQCRLKGDAWTKPEKLNDNINTKFHESSASLSYDGNTLYFVSDRTDEGTRGYRDIWMSRLDKKGRWGKAVNLGPVINTPYGEEGVFIHPDGKTMYFSSQGHKSMGGYDIFKSVYENGNWSEPKNIGYPINTPDDDVFFVISGSGKHGYYASFKNVGFGEKDIYRITFLGPEKQPLLNNEDNLLASVAEPVKEAVAAPAVEIQTASITILKGTITDALSQKVLEADIELVDNTKNEVIATFSSNSNTGKYLVSLPAGRNYGIAVKKEGYLFHSENFDIPASSAYQEVVKDIQLKNVAVGTKIVLRNIFFDFDKASLRPESANELERLTKLMNDVPGLKIEISGHTDNKGSETYNQRLSEARSKSVVDYLIAKGIASNRLEYKGYGLSQPMATNDTDEGRQLNRRTEFKILGK